jgi:hypothetical protein
VPGNQESDELVTQLFVGHRLALLVAGEQEHREDVLTLIEVGNRSAPIDLLVDQLVHEPPAVLEALPHRGTEPAAGQREQEHAEPVGGGIHHCSHPPLQLLLARALLDAEHRAHDHAERQRLHRGQQRERLPHRPRVDRPVGGLAHDLLVGAHPRAVERREQQLAVAHVLGAVQQQHRPLAHHRAEHRIGLARA